MTTTEKLQVLNVFLILMILLLVGKLYSAYWHSEQEARAIQEPPDLMEQALVNISMRKMQLQLRELLVYSEPNEMHELLREYMRLRDEQDKKEAQ